MVGDDLMATQVVPSAAPDDARFFFKLAVAIAATIFAAFSLHLALGRSSFGAPTIVHLHAVVFMGWVVIYVLQHGLAASGRIALHRQMGRLALLWVVLMLWFGMAVTIAVIQRGQAPFFFLPQHFLVANPLTLFAFVGLIGAAVAMRKQTDWHRRLHLCAMAMILGPAFGRLFPSPFLIPWAFEVATLAGLIFPLIAVWREWRTGAVHPAWKWGLPVLPIVLTIAYFVGHSDVGGAIYHWVVAGTPGANVDPLAYGPVPPELR